MTNHEPEPRDGTLIELLQEHDGRPTDVVLRDGRRLTVFNIAWGYDIGGEFAHVTTNVSPDVPGATSDFFYTEDVAEIVDPATGAVLHRG